MARSCPVGLDVKKLREEVESIYSRVAEAPDGEFHFHRGAEYAARLLGYDANELLRLPAQTTASFAGVANPFVAGVLPVGATVVDIGSGAGMDALLAATQVGATGQVIGIDPTDAMLHRARAAAATLPHLKVEFRKGAGEDLPVSGASVDVVISNGVVNLAPHKDLVFHEVFRVLKPGGRFQLADIVVGTELSESTRRDIDLWTG